MSNRNMTPQFPIQESIRPETTPLEEPSPGAALKRAPRIASIWMRRHRLEGATTQFSGLPCPAAQFSRLQRRSTLAACSGGCRPSYAAGGGVEVHDLLNGFQKLVEPEGFVQHGLGVQPRLAGLDD